MSLSAPTRCTELGCRFIAVGAGVALLAHAAASLARGAGAIGGWIGIRLAASGHSVAMLARGQTLAALQSVPWLAAASSALRRSPA